MEATNRERWKSVNGFANYEISSCGRVRNATTERMLKSSYDGQGYLKINLHKEGKPSTMTIHRLVAEAFVDNPEGKRCVDHIDSNRRNNNWENLRPATYLENNRNQTKTSKPTSSIYKGVDYDKRAGSWRARICAPEKRIHLGFFTSEREAGFAYNPAAIKFYKEFAKLNDLD
jgi:hypothetical protein